MNPERRLQLLQTIAGPLVSPGAEQVDRSLFASVDLHMPKVQTNWTEIIGLPSSGKSAMIEGLKARGFPVQDEVARMVIQRGIEAGFTAEEVFSDKLVLEDVIMHEGLRRALMLDPNDHIIFDTGLLTTLAFYQANDLPTDHVRHIPTHFRLRSVFYLDPLPVLDDGIRPQSAEERRRIDDSMLQLYCRDGYHILRIPPFETAEQRLDFLVQQLERKGIVPR